MNDADRKSVQALLRSALPPVGAGSPRHDLWPRMTRRLQRSSTPSFTWFDVVLASLAAAGFVAFPEAIPWVLFHL